MTRTEEESQEWLSGAAILEYIGKIGYAMNLRIIDDYIGCFDELVSIDRNENTDGNISNISVASSFLDICRVKLSLFVHPEKTQRLLERQKTWNSEFYDIKNSEIQSVVCPFNESLSDALLITSVMSLYSELGLAMHDGNKNSVLRAFNVLLNKLECCDIQSGISLSDHNELASFQRFRNLYVEVTDNKLSEQIGCLRSMVTKISNSRSQTSDVNLTFSDIGYLIGYVGGLAICLRTYCFCTHERSRSVSDLSEYLHRLHKNHCPHFERSVFQRNRTDSIAAWFRRKLALKIYGSKLLDSINNRRMNHLEDYRDRVSTLIDNMSYKMETHRTELQYLAGLVHHYGGLGGAIASYDMKMVRNESRYILTCMMRMENGAYSGGSTEEHRFLDRQRWLDVKHKISNVIDIDSGEPILNRLAND